jgi:hypothetical protein
MGNPAEIPAEMGGGGSGHIDWSKWHGGIGGPAELPPPDWVKVSAAQLVTEVFRLRNRVHVLESNILAAKMRAGGVSSFWGGIIGGPNELPEGEGGGGGGSGGGHWPGEIHEIAELPISRLVTEFASLVTRFAQFEAKVSAQLNTLSQRIDTLKR